MVFPLIKIKITSEFTDSDEEESIRGVKLPNYPTAPKKLQPNQDTNMLHNASSEDEAMTVQAECADSSGASEIFTSPLAPTIPLHKVKVHLRRVVSHCLRIKHGDDLSIHNIVVTGCFTCFRLWKSSLVSPSEACWQVSGQGDDHSTFCKSNLGWPCGSCRILVQGNVPLVWPDGDCQCGKGNVDIQLSKCKHSPSATRPFELFTNALMAQFNMKGKKGKKSLEKTQMRS